MGIADQVTFAGVVDDSELPLYYHLCDVFVMVSRYDPALRYVEGFGIVYLEEAACGKPTIGGTPDAIEDGVTGLPADPDDFVNVAATIAELVNDPERARAMGNAGYQRVHRLFSRAHRLEQVVEQILADQR